MLCGHVVCVVMLCGDVVVDGGVSDVEGSGKVK